MPRPTVFIFFTRPDSFLLLCSKSSTRYVCLLQTRVPVCGSAAFYTTMHWQGEVRKEHYSPANCKCCNCPLLWALKQIKMVLGMPWARSGVVWGDAEILTWSVFCPSLEQQVLQITVIGLQIALKIVLISFPSGLLMGTHTVIKYYFICFFLLLSWPANSLKIALVLWSQLASVAKSKALLLTENYVCLCFVLLLFQVIIFAKKQ